MAVARAATIDLNRVATLVAVVDAGSFTAAAAALELPKSSVSRALAALEHDLGIRLLQRSTRKLSLTDAGRTYLEQVRPALAALQNASCAIASLGTQPRGTVRVTAAPESAELLAEVFGKFHRANPEVRVEVALTERHVDLVEEGFDLAVRAGQLQDSSLIVRRIGQAAFGLYASQGYLRRAGRPKTPGELESHACILFRAQGGRTTWNLVGPDGDRAVPVRGPFTGDTLRFVEAAVEAGLGIGLLPIFRMKDSPAVRLLPEHTARHSALYVVSPSRGYEPAAVTALREAIVARLLALDIDAAT